MENDIEKNIGDDTSAIYIERTDIYTCQENAGRSFYRIDNAPDRSCGFGGTKKKGRIIRPLAHTVFPLDEICLSGKFLNELCL